jgi:hypothetical protein
METVYLLSFAGVSQKRPKPDPREDIQLFL